MSQKAPDDLSYEIKNEFRKIHERVEELEFYVEENLIELRDNINRESINSLIDALSEFTVMYDEFLSSVLSIAGEVRGYSKVGANKIRKIEDIKEQLSELINDLKDLLGFAKEYTVKRDYVEKIKNDMIRKVNESIKTLRTYISEQLDYDLKVISEELQKMEKYYESYEEV